MVHDLRKKPIFKSKNWAELRKKYGWRKKCSQPEKLASKKQKKN